MRQRHARHAGVGERIWPGFGGFRIGDRGGFLLVLEWFENFRLRHELEAGREAAKAFWRTEVLREGCTTEPWQVEQWLGEVHKR
jgi:hypothetical protein